MKYEQNHGTSTIDLFNEICVDTMDKHNPLVDEDQRF